jgi:AraC-like DNA-binding protein/mannose-6-phosphate isomerase-like protein (cupin superfamily)
MVVDFFAKTFTIAEARMRGQVPLERVFRSGIREEAADRCDPVRVHRHPLFFKEHIRRVGMFAVLNVTRDRVKFFQQIFVKFATDFVIWGEGPGRMPPKMLLNEKIGYCDQILRLSISRQIRKEAAKLPVRWHVHKDFELLLVEEGNVEIRLTDATYLLNPGDVLVIGPMEPHVTWRIHSDKLVYFVLHFDLQPYMDSTTLMHHRFFSDPDNPISSINRWIQADGHLRKRIGDTIVSIYEEIEGRAIGYEMAVSLLVKQLMLLILRSNPEMQALDQNRPSAALRNVIDYVEKHLSEKIDMLEISKMANMSYHHFSKYFKKAMGLSFVEYVNMRRIKRAENLLLSESVNVSEIARKVGMTNMTRFYELFKHYNQCSPKEYVRKFHPSLRPGRENMNV